MSKKEKELEQRIETLEKMVMIMHLQVQTNCKAMTELLDALNELGKNLEKIDSKSKPTPTDPLTKTLFRD